DGDGDQELIAGVRDDKDDANRRGLRIYDPRPTGPADWKHHRVDAGGVAIEDLAATDLDGDGRIDIVAVGRQTQNVRIYWNQTGASAPETETQ
ncbi:MAG: FG-GAP-like repeat-containing protein, partial [Pirellulales bacterium]